MRGGRVQEVGGYELLATLGSGGSGTVYRALDADGRIVALKLLHPHLCADAGARERLAREVANLRRVRHPAVAQMLDAEIDSAEPFLVTELVPGVDLGGLVASRGPMAPADLADLAEQLRAALCTVHAAGVLHRDLSPGNVMITDDAGPVLIDFGIAQTLDDSRMTSTGLVTGTPGYVAPELLEGGEPSAAGDWWGWAATLAFAATGRPPFGRGAAVVALDRARKGQVDVAGLDARVAAALRSALAPDPWRRAAPETVVAELVRAATTPGPPPPPAPGPPPPPLTGVTTPVATPWGGLTARTVALDTGGPDDGRRTRVMPSGGPPPPPPAAPGYPQEYGVDHAVRYGAEYEGEYPGQYPGQYAGHDGEPQYWTGTEAAVPTPTRRAVTVLVLALPVVAFGVAWPAAALLVGAACVLLVRSIGLAAEVVQRRAIRRGERRPADVVRGVLAWPWHLARAVVGAAPTVLLAGAVGIGLWLTARWALGGHPLAVPPAGEPVGVVPGNAEWVGRAVLAVVVMSALVIAWFGPGSRPTRVGARWVLSGLGPGPAGAGVLILAVLAATAVLAALMVTHVVVWWPLTGPPGAA